MSCGGPGYALEYLPSPGRAAMFNGYDWHGRRIEVREVGIGLVFVAFDGWLAEWGRVLCGSKRYCIEGLDRVRGGSLMGAWLIYGNGFIGGLHGDKFGPPAGGARPAPASSSSRYEQSRDFGRGGDNYGYNSGSGQRGYREESSRRDHHSHDVFDGASHTSMASIPSGPAAGSGDQIYVRNLPLTTTSQDLKDLFRTCGPIRMAEMLESGGRSKGSGIVRFDLY
ncbi:hypothetical protein BGX24_004402, partial [Mortierella sp. AD032]